MITQCAWLTSPACSPDVSTATNYMWAAHLTGRFPLIVWTGSGVSTLNAGMSAIQVTTDLKRSGSQTFGTFLTRKLQLSVRTWVAVLTGTLAFSVGAKFEKAAVST